MKTLKLFFDIDGCCANVGDRFKGVTPPKDQTRGNPEFEAYLEAIQQPELLMKDVPVEGMQKLVEAFPDAVYLTSRDEKYRRVTEAWLRRHNFPDRELIMRPDGNKQVAAEFKKGVIQDRVGWYYNNGQAHITSESVIVFDDDPAGLLEKVCLENGWTFLKARSGGSAI